MYTRMYPGKYAPAAVQDRLKARIAALKEQYGLVDAHRPNPQPRQLSLEAAVY